MKIVTRKDVNKLISAPICYALFMEKEQLDEVIATFISVRNKLNGGGQNQ